MKVIHSVFSETYIEKFVRKMYNIKGISTRLFHTGINDFYSIKTDGETYFLRISPAKRVFESKREYYQAEVDLIHYLLKNNFHTVELVATRDGEFVSSLSSIEGERFILLAKKMEDTPPDWRNMDEEDWKRLGKTLAIMHRYMRESPNQYRPKFDQDLFLGNFKKSIAEFIGKESEDWKALELKIEDVSSYLDILLEESPQGLVHGDFTHGNITMSGNDFLVFDFDYIWQGPQYFDILTISRILSRFKEAYIVFFLDGYESEDKLSKKFKENRKDLELLVLYYYMGIWSQKRDYFSKAYIGDRFTGNLHEILGECK